METSSRYFVADLVEELGSLPTVAAQIVSLTSDPDCDIGDLSRLIQSDSVMTMRFLALANSAAMSGAHETRDLRGALVRLGLRRVRNVSLFMGMHDMNPADQSGTVLDMREFWKYNLACASCAQGLAWQKGIKAFEDAWLAGILHGIGIIALDQKAESGFRTALKLAREKGLPLAEAEMMTLEFHHGELGARILKQWGLPHLFAEVVDFHTEKFMAGEVSPEAAELIPILQEAITVVRAFAFGHGGDPSPPVPLEVLGDHLGLAEPAVEALAAKVDREVGDLSRLVGLNLDGDHFQDALAESKVQAARLGLEGFEDTLAKEKLEEQLAMAREIQQHLLPQSLPGLPGYEIAAANYPSLQVSGDTYDFLKLKQGLCGLVIADVCGKGMPASLLASNLQASMRALGMVFDDPGELLASVNNALFESTNPEHFATLFLAALEPGSGTFRYASAGHNSPLLLRQDGTAEWLKPAGTPLGMFPDMKYPVMEIKLQPGDMVVAYTDGITEAISWQGEEFEESGLETAVRNCPGESCENLIECVMARVLDHVSPGEGTGGGQEPGPSLAEQATRIDAGDDLTMVVFRFQG
jgi:serine phosphatase RsbU (regulator of sigma subunit)/HD-like signal output (HDOD) protein